MADQPGASFLARAVAKSGQAARPQASARRAEEWLGAGGFFEWVPREPMRHTDKLNIFHAEFGDPEAPTLLLVHGFSTSSIDWYDVVPALSCDHRVCVLDFPGFGFSDKPKGESYTIERDCDLLEHYLCEVLGAQEGAIVAHDRGDSVVLTFVARGAFGETTFELSHLVLSNGNIFLPLSNLSPAQRLLLDPVAAPRVIAASTPETIAAVLGESLFTPPRSLEDPAVRALADVFAFKDGIAVIHDTIHYLVERAENEQQWLEALALSPVPTTLMWGLHDPVAPFRVAAHVWNTYVSTKPGENQFWLLPRASHYLQHDQPQAFVEVVSVALSNCPPKAPGPLSTAPGAPVLIDRSRAELPSADAVLAGA